MNVQGQVILRWADGEYPFALGVKEVDELQRVTAKTVVEAMSAAGVPVSGLARAILEACGVGAIWQRLLSGNYLAGDITETVRLSLIGGGMEALRAKTMCETYIVGHPLASRSDIEALNAGELPHQRGNAVSNYGVALAVLQACLYGLDELATKRPGSEGNGQAATSTAGSSI